VCGIYIGAAGVLLGNKSSQITNLLKKKYPHIKIKCATDILNVIASANIDEDCIAVICGTGSSVLIKNGDTLNVVAGWGYLVGKWGSGFDIARDGLHSALAHTEKIGPPTAITELLQNKSEKSVYELLDEVYKHDPSYMASFAPIVFEAYRSGDEVAKGILTENAQKLANNINVAHKAYNSGKKIVLSGGLCSDDGSFQTLLRSYLDKDLEIFRPIYPQICGACLLCAQMCGVDTEPIKEGFMTQYKRRIR
jgi:N-acetylglucosamine kinase-like BadF-type ATPase